METITKFVADDGSEHTTADSARERDNLVLAVNRIMDPLGSTPEAVERGKGWVQHDPEVVLRCRDGIFSLAKTEGVLGDRQGPGRDYHPLSIVGRILDDGGGPLAYAWSRFCRIDEQGREHQQCYFAYTAGPAPEHTMIEDRR